MSSSAASEAEQDRLPARLQTAVLHVQTQVARRCSPATARGNLAARWKVGYAGAAAGRAGRVGETRRSYDATGISKVRQFRFGVGRAKRRRSGTARDPLSAYASNLTERAKLGRSTR